MRPFNKHFTPKLRPKKNLLITGIDPVLNAIKEGIQLERIFLDIKESSPKLSDLKVWAEQSGTPINKVPVEKLRSFNIEFADGCIALKSKIVYQQLQNVISQVVDRGEVPLFLILDGITDIRNIGAIARTAYGCGVHAMVIPEKGVGALNDDAITTSAGALEQITVCRVKSLHGAIDEMHLNGIKVFASEMKAEKVLFDCGLKDPLAIIVGSEDKGIHPSLYKIADETFSIPMKNDFESFNVSVAAGMILYEVMRQRMI